MKLATRLIVTLVPAVTVVMAGFGTWALIDRERTLFPQTSKEVRAYAAALDAAFEFAFRDLAHAGVQQLVNEISRDPRVYAVIVYNKDGIAQYVSDPVSAPGTAPREILQDVLKTGQTTAFERRIEGQRVYSALRALRDPAGSIMGALEVAQPLTFLEEEQAALRWQFIAITLTLLLTLSLLTLWIVRRVLADRLDSIVEAVSGLGADAQAQRVPEDPAGAELAELAREFNSMVDRLEKARESLLRESEDRLALERQLRDAERMAAIGTLAAGLAHEIASPMNVISGRAELLLQRLPAESREAPHLRIIVDQIARITGIVRSLLDFARRRPPRLELLDVGRLARGAAEFLETEFERLGVKLHWHTNGTAEAIGDADQLHQVLVNLMLNAAQSMDGTERERELHVTIEGPGGENPSTVIVDIRDTGCGVTPDAREQLFTPFASTKREGTGLGLVVARGIVESHGGTLALLDGDGQPGATFRMTLPVPASAPNDPEPGAAGQAGDG